MCPSVSVQQVSEGQVIGYMVNDRQMKLTLAFSAEYARSDISTGQTATVSIRFCDERGERVRYPSVETAQQISSEGVRVIPRRHYGE